VLAISMWDVLSSGARELAGGLVDPDGNPATTADPSWVSLVTTPAYARIQRANRGPDRRLEELFHTPHLNLTLISTAVPNVTRLRHRDLDGVMYTTAGTFLWQAADSGDANNNPASSDCSTEELDVKKNVTGHDPPRRT
jgi:hypothetical protein